MKLFILTYVVVEIYLLIVFADAISGLGVVMWVIGGFFVGSALIRKTGLMFLIQRPTVNLPITFYHIIAGMLIFIPSLITDALGILFLIPAFQNKLLQLLRPYTHSMSSRFYNFKHQNHQSTDDGVVVEGEVNVKDNDNHKIDKTSS